MIKVPGTIDIRKNDLGTWMQLFNYKYMNKSTTIPCKIIMTSVVNLKTSLRMNIFEHARLHKQGCKQDGSSVGY